MSLLLALAVGCRRRAPEHELVTSQENVVRIGAGRVRDGKAHFFTYKYDGRNVNFFLRCDGGGTLRAHLDACYSCYKYRRGYVQQGREVVCLACRIGYDLETPVWDYVGPCVPIGIQCRIREADVIVSVSTLEKGSRFF